jgi:pimeloyl-ACP methyl ester carboxylesterase
MENFEKSSINKIFEKEREEYIPEVGKQFENKMRTEIEINGEKLDIDFRIISIKDLEKKDADPVLLLPGFGSGWEGISELGFSLACEGRKVIMPSLPGYGNSDNPSEKYYDDADWNNEAEAIRQLVEKLKNEGKKFHLIGHSMGSEILAAFAEKNRDKVASLVLLNPAGVKEKENQLLLGAKFISSGIRTAAEYGVSMYFSGEKDYQKELWKHIPKTKSPFAGDRLKQRLAEAKKVSQGHLLEKLKKLDVPVTYISGKLDSVYPPGKPGDDKSQLSKIIEAVKDKSKLETSVMAGLQHNTTIAPDEITAANIEHYLEKAERGI